MCERSTNHQQSKKDNKVCFPTEDPILKRGGNSTKASNSSWHPVSVGKGHGAGYANFLSGKKPKVDPRIKKLEDENKKLKEALVMQTQELMLFKKKMDFAIRVIIIAQSNNKGSSKKCPAFMG